MQELRRTRRAAVDTVAHTLLAGDLVHTPSAVLLIVAETDRTPARLAFRVLDEYPNGQIYAHTLYWAPQTLVLATREDVTRAHRNEDHPPQLSPPGAASA